MYKYLTGNTKFNEDQLSTLKLHIKEPYLATKKHKRTYNKDPGQAYTSVQLWSKVYIVCKWKESSKSVN